MNDDDQRDTLSEIPDRIIQMACDALRQANIHAIFAGPGAEHFPNLSIVNAALAGELFLKAVIAQHHPLLIFKDLFSLDRNDQNALSIKSIIERGRTYNFEHLPKLLWVVTGERLNDNFSFEKLRVARNSIQHFCAPDIDRPGNLALRFLYRNIDPIIKRHMGINAIDHIDPDEVDYLIEQLIRNELDFSTDNKIEVSEFDLEEALRDVSEQYRLLISHKLKPHARS